jgi:hypothetical protein
MSEEMYGELEIYIGYTRLSVRDLTRLLAKANRLYGSIASMLADPDMEHVTFKHFRHYNELEIIDFDKGSLKLKTVANKVAITVVGGVLTGVIANYTYDFLTRDESVGISSVMQEKVLKNAAELYNEANRNNDITEFIFTYTDSTGHIQKVEVKTQRYPGDRTHESIK